MLPGDVLLTPNWRWHGHANESPENAVWIDFLDVPIMHFLDGGMFFEHHAAGIECADSVDERSPMRFPFAETRNRFVGGIRSVELGPPKLDTLGLHVSRLQAGEKCTAPRSTASHVYAVIDGHGRANVDGTRFEWRRGDVFVVPAWRPHELEAIEPSHLFRVTDEPLLARLNWLRSEA
jgi:gentisate 1,2-dioxygenase